MIWVLLFSVSPSVLAVYVAYRNWKWGTDVVGFWMLLVLGIICWLVLTGLMSAIGFGISSAIGSFLRDDHQYWTPEPTWVGDMVSMRSSDGVQGSIQGGIFMIAGKIESSLIYHYYTRKKNGSFQPHKWTADNDTSIFEEDRKDGQAIQYQTEWRPGWLEWIAEKDERTRMEFHIPKGSIHQEFNV